MNRKIFRENKEEILQGTKLTFVKNEDQKRMVYYTSLPLIVQHNDKSNSNPMCLTTSPQPENCSALSSQAHIINLSSHGLDVPIINTKYDHMSSEQRATNAKMGGMEYFRTNISQISANGHKDNLKVPQFKCSQCDISLGSKSAYTSHMKSHNKTVQDQITSIHSNVSLEAANNPNLRPNDQYQCDVCKKNFAVPARLIRHYRTHTGERPFECEFCHKFFSVKENLQVHRRIHTKERPYKCSVCERAFEHSGKLHRHMRIHTGERPHKCNVCGKTFIQSGQLVIHMRTHTGEKPYRCPEPGCGKGFTCSKQLKVHSRTHSGEKPYQCDICFRDFGYNHVLKLHRVQHYGSKCYKCTICDETFKNKKEMENHIKAHANEIPDDDNNSQKSEQYTSEESMSTYGVNKETTPQNYSAIDDKPTLHQSSQPNVDWINQSNAIPDYAQSRFIKTPESTSSSSPPPHMDLIDYSNSRYEINKIRETFISHMVPTTEFKPLLQSSDDIVKRVEAALGCENIINVETPPRSSSEDDRSYSPDSDSLNLFGYRANNTLPPRKRRLYFKNNQDESTNTRINSVIQFAKTT